MYLFYIKAFIYSFVILRDCENWCLSKYRLHGDIDLYPWSPRC